METEKYLFSTNVSKVYFISILDLKASFYLEIIKLTTNDKNKINLRRFIRTRMFLFMLEKTKKIYGLLNFTKIYCCLCCTWPSKLFLCWRPVTIRDYSASQNTEAFGSSAIVWKTKNISPIFIFNII